jgi:biopolymer transport protein ExbD
VTPLIDVLLVLLIIFMVITPVKPSKFEAKVPAEPKNEQQLDVKPNPLTLVIAINRETRGLVAQQRVCRQH